MNGIDRLGAAPPVAAGTDTRDARSLAGDAIGEIGSRIQAWASHLSGGPASDGAFSPDNAELARGGDVYGLRDLVGELSGQLGASPTESGELLRAAETLTREIAIQVHGLAGAGEGRQLAGVNAAIDDALALDAPDGVDGAIARFEAAADALARHNS